MNSHKKGRKDIIFLLKIGLITRLLVYAGIVAAFYLFPSYDFSVEVAMPFGSLSTFLHPFVRWDSLYFLQIAYNSCKYRFEPEYAFFPLYPFLMSCLAPIFRNMCRINALVLSGIAISLLSFIFSIILLYSLTVEIFKSTRLAFLSCVMLILSPASIFLTAVYSESLFLMLSLAGMLCFVKEFHFAASLFFALSSFTRANGVFHSGFFLYHSFVVLISPNSCGVFSRISRISTQLFNFLIALSGFGIFQWYCYNSICHSGINISDEAMYWCNNPPFLGLLYTFVQKEYWGVGFLHYYRFKQIPNFLIAGPMVFSLIYSLFRYPSIISKGGHTLFIRTFPFLVEWLAIGVITITTAHVQIATRLFSSFAPMLYWTWALLILESFKEKNPLDQGAAEATNDDQNAIKPLYPEKSELSAIDRDTAQSPLHYKTINLTQDGLVDAAINANFYKLINPTPESHKIKTWSAVFSKMYEQLELLVKDPKLKSSKFLSTGLFPFLANICSVEDDRIPFIILRFLVTFKKSLPSFEKSEPAYLSLLVNVTTKVLLSRNEDKEAFAAMIGIIDLRFLEELLGFIGQDGILCFEKKGELSLYLLRNISAIEYYSVRLISKSYFGKQFLQLCLVAFSNMEAMREILFEIIKLAMASFYGLGTACSSQQTHSHWIYGRNI
ncbi:hypothetical protein DI09_21p180 [Mitosporidium daphniae]|uniref:GPI mannosyltransferase 2 n=1 Tax=Mitosporidium daphniae TaxID=1485682 RepID=A0A098VWB6_9MICR|nr:uncharacterized protein DI09_21p180 [Mitosporidium daphniae]KGG52046.1 hypothetical protein DI09_21p180 [Mitosporidium daphniae]|eukprot:XP_013238473.1 uncharacterized protein DI09_21p180 [Mitosporidium daphniae]